MVYRKNPPNFASLLIIKLSRYEKDTRTMPLRYPLFLWRQW